MMARLNILTARRVSAVTTKHTLSHQFMLSEIQAVYLLHDLMQRCPFLFEGMLYFAVSCAVGFVKHVLQ